MVVKRQQQAPPPVEGVNFGDLGFYNTGGFTLPEGDYALYFDVRVHAYTKADGTKGTERLGVMVTAHSLTGEGEPAEQFYSMGSKAHLSYAPNPDTGKGLLAIPGGPATGLAGKTNWNELLKSLYDSGLPQGIFGNNLGVMDGVWVHTQNVPEPEDRKAFAAATGEVEQERRANLISIVSEILEGGAPWEGGGGMPEAVEAAPAAPAPRVAPRPPAARPAPAAAAKPGSKAVAVRPKAAPVPAAESGEEDVMQAAVNGVSAVLEANPKGCSRLLLRTGTFKAVGAAEGPDMAQAVSDTFFSDDGALNSILGQHGYKMEGNMVKLL